MGANGMRPDSVGERESAGGAAKGKLSVEDQRRLDKLQQRDREVRQHEQMHLSAGKDLITSGPTYSYEKGPDGQNYAVSGEVGIDTSEAATPEKTLPKAERIRAAALAPPDPSAQDRQVAAMADSMQMSALMEIAQKRLDESQEQNQERAVENRQAGGLGEYQRMMEGGLRSASGISAYA